MKVRVAHTSLQFGDTDKQHTHDLEKIFDRLVQRRVAWITGTEAGPGSGNTGEELLRISRASGYRPWVPSEQDHLTTDCWIAVREDLISGHWDTDFEKVIPSSAELYAAHDVDGKRLAKWGPRGLVTVGFDCNKLGGRVNLAATHHLTGGHNKEHAVEHGIDHYEWNEVLDEALTEWMRDVAAGPSLAFAGMDRNAADTSSQKIAGATTLADELKKWQNTGHGPIDWIVSYNRDGRVSGENFHVLNDKEFHLNMDHFYLEGTFDVELPAKR